MDFDKPGLWVVYLNGGVFQAEEDTDGYRTISYADDATMRGVAPKVEIMHVDHSTGTVVRMPFSRDMFQSEEID